MYKINIMENNKRKFKPVWSVLCQESSIDSNTNSISLFKVLEEAQFNLDMNEIDKMKDMPGFDPAKPMAFPFKYQLVTLWKNVSDNSTLLFNTKLLIKDPKGKVLNEATHDIAFEIGKDRMRGITNFDGFLLTEPGFYTFSVLAKEAAESSFEEVAEVPVKVSINLNRNKK